MSSKIITLLASAALAGGLFATPADARGGGGHGGGGHGGGFGGGHLGGGHFGGGPRMGGHFGGGFRGFRGFHRRGFAFAPFAYGYSSFDDGYGYGCTEPLTRVWTSSGWRWRRIC